MTNICFLFFLELNYRDPEIYFKVDIGLPIVHNKELRGEKVNQVEKKNSALHGQRKFYCIFVFIPKNNFLFTWH